MASPCFLPVCNPFPSRPPLSEGILDGDLTYYVAPRVLQPVGYAERGQRMYAVVRDLRAANTKFSRTRTFRTECNPAAWTRTMPLSPLRRIDAFEFTVSASSQDLDNKFAVVLKPNDRLTFSKLQQAVPSLSERDAAVDAMLKAVISGESVVALYDDRETAATVATKLEELDLLVSVVPAASVANLVNRMGS